MAAGLEILVRAGASRDEVAGEHDGALVIRLTAPPHEGRANRALRKLIAKRAGVAASKVEIVRGERSPRKIIRIAGLPPDELRTRLRGG